MSKYAIQLIAIAMGYHHPRDRLLPFVSVLVPESRSRTRFDFGPGVS